MHYSVLTFIRTPDGRLVNKSNVICHDLAEAKALASVFDGLHNPGNTTFERRATVCVMGYSDAGKYIIPLEELDYIKRSLKEV